MYETCLINENRKIKRNMEVIKKRIFYYVWDNQTRRTIKDEITYAYL